MNSEIGMGVQNLISLIPTKPHDKQRFRSECIEWCFHSFVLGPFGGQEY
jgi:hypothetical protein